MREKDSQAEDRKRSDEEFLELQKRMERRQNEIDTVVREICELFSAHKFKVYDVERVCERVCEWAKYAVVDGVPIR